MAKYHYREELSYETAGNNSNIIRGHNENVREEDRFIEDRCENIIKRNNKQKMLSLKNKTNNVRTFKPSSVHLIPSDLSIGSFKPALLKTKEKVERSNEINKEQQEFDNNNQNIILKRKNKISKKTISNDYFFVVPISEIGYPEAPKTILKRLKDMNKLSKKQHSQWPQKSVTKGRTETFTHGEDSNISKQENNDGDLNGQTKKPIKKLRPASKQDLLNTNMDVEKIEYGNREKWVVDSFHNLRENVLKFVSNKFPYTDTRLNEHNQINKEEIKLAEQRKLIGSKIAAYKWREDSQEKFEFGKKRSKCMNKDANPENTNKYTERCERFTKQQQHNITKRIDNYPQNDCNLKYAQSNLSNGKQLGGKNNHLKKRKNNFKDNTTNNDSIRDHDDLGSDVIILNASDSQFFKITDFLKIKHPHSNSKRELTGKLLYECEMREKENFFPKDSILEESAPIKRIEKNEKRNPIRFSLDSLNDVLVYTGKVDKSTIKSLSKNCNRSSLSNSTSRILNDTDSSLKSNKSFRKRPRREHKSSQDTQIKDYTSKLDMIPESDRLQCNQTLKRESNKICTQGYDSKDSNKVTIPVGCDLTMKRSKKSNNSLNEPLKLIKSQYLAVDPLTQSGLNKLSSKSSGNYFLEAEKEIVSDKKLSEDSTVNEIEINNTKYSIFKINENEPESSFTTLSTICDKQPLSKSVYQANCVNENNNKSQSFVQNNLMSNKSKISVSIAVQTDLLNESEGEDNYLKNTKGTNTQNTKDKNTSDLDEYIYINKHIRSQIENATPKFVQTEPISLMELVLYDKQNCFKTILKKASNISIAAESDILEPVAIISEPDDFFEDFISYENKKLCMGSKIYKPNHLLETSNGESNNHAKFSKYPLEALEGKNTMPLSHLDSEKQASSEPSKEFIYNRKIEKQNKTLCFDKHIPKTIEENIDRTVKHYKSEYKFLQCTGWQFFQTLLDENCVLKENMTIFKEPQLLTNFTNEETIETHHSNYKIVNQVETIPENYGQCDLDNDTKLGIISNKNDGLECPTTLNSEQIKDKEDNYIKPQNLKLQSLEESNMNHFQQSMEMLKNSVVLKFEDKPQTSTILVKSMDRSNEGMKSVRTLHSIARILDVSSEEMQHELPNLTDKYKSFNSCTILEKPMETENTKLNLFETPVAKSSLISFAMQPYMNFSNIPIASHPTINKTSSEWELINPNTSYDEEQVEIIEKENSELVKVKSKHATDYTDQCRLATEQSLHQILKELPFEYGDKSKSDAKKSLISPDIKLIKSNVSSFELIRLNISIRNKSFNEPKRPPNMPYKKSLILMPMNHIKNDDDLSSKGEKNNQESAKNIDLNAHCLCEDSALKNTSKGILSPLNIKTPSLLSRFPSKTSLQMAIKGSVEQGSSQSVLHDKGSLRTGKEMELYLSNSIDIAKLALSTNPSKIEERASNHKIATKNIDKTSLAREIENSKTRTKSSIKRKLNRIFLCHYLSYIPFINKFSQVGGQKILKVDKGQGFKLYSRMFKCYTKNQMLESFALIENPLNKLLNIYCFGN